MTTNFQIIYEHTVKRLPRLAATSTSAIHGWLEAGCNVHTDILPTIDRIAEKYPNIGGFPYFTRAILKAKEEREAAAPKPRHYDIDTSIDADARKAKRIRASIKFGVRIPENERWLAEYEAKHGRVEA